MQFSSGTDPDNCAFIIISEESQQIECCGQWQPQPEWNLLEQVSLATISSIVL